MGVAIECKRRGCGKEDPMKILIGIDDSSFSRAVIQFASRFSWPQKTTVLVVSAVPSPVMAYAEMYVQSMETASEILEMQRKASQELVSRAEQDLLAAGITTRSRVLDGDPREAIVQTAKDEGIDLILVGSHGRTGVSKLLMGSVASHVVTHAPCSVLVVKEART
jgi:nucleotide-binding universal stress UspA family protein